jgi:hypothetical protein
VDSPVATANQSSPWLAKTPEKDWHVNWHDVRVASVKLLIVVVCVAAVAAMPGGLTLACIYGAGSFLGGTVGCALMLFGLIGCIFGGVLAGLYFDVGQDPLLLKAYDNEVVKQALSGENGLIQRLVNAGNLTQVDLDNFTKTYEELKKVISNQGSKTFSAFNPNSPAMAEVLHYLFLHGNADIIRDTIELISGIAPELTEAAAVRTFEECFPLIKTEEQLVDFLSAFSNCTCQLPTKFWSMVSDATRPGGALIHKLTIPEGASGDKIKILQAVVERNPDIMRPLLDSCPNGLSLDAIMLFTGVAEKQNDTLIKLLENFSELNRESILRVLRIKDANGNLLAQSLFSIIPDGRRLAYRIFEKWDIGDLLSLKNDSNNPLIVCLFSACTLPEQRNEFIDFIAKIQPQKQIALLEERGRGGRPLAISMLSACDTREQWKQFLDFIAKFSPLGRVQLFNQKDRNGETLIELLSVHMEHTSLTLQLMEMLVVLRDDYKMHHIHAHQRTTNPTLARMFRVVGTRPRQ